MPDNSGAPVFDDELSKKLLDASEADEYTEVETMLQKNVDVNVKDKNGYTPLMFVLKKKRHDLATSLIEKGADVNAMATNGVTVMSLCYAYEIPVPSSDQAPPSNDQSFKNYLSLLKLVVEKWCTPTLADEYKATLTDEQRATMDRENNVYISIFKTAVYKNNWLVVLVLLTLFKECNISPPYNNGNILKSLSYHLYGKVLNVNTDYPNSFQNDIDFDAVRALHKILLPAEGDPSDVKEQIAVYGAHTGNLKMIEYSCGVKVAQNRSTEVHPNKYVLNPLPYSLNNPWNDDYWQCVQYLITNDASLKCIELYLEALYESKQVGDDIKSFEDLSKCSAILDDAERKILEDVVRVRKVTPPLTTVIADRLFDGFTSDVFKFLLGKMYASDGTKSDSITYDKYCTIMETIIKSIGDKERTAQTSGNCNNSQHNKLATFMSILDEHHYEKYKERVFELSKLFILNGANVNGKWSNCNTALHTDTASTALLFATKHNNDKVSTMLIEEKADVNMKDNNGYTALMFALKNQRHKVAKLLVEKGADVNAMATNGVTVMSLCCACTIPVPSDEPTYKDYISLVKFLVKKMFSLVIDVNQTYNNVFKTAVNKSNWLVLLTSLKECNIDFERQKEYPSDNNERILDSLSDHLRVVQQQQKTNNSNLFDNDIDFDAVRALHKVLITTTDTFSILLFIAVYGAHIGNLKMIEYAWPKLPPPSKRQLRSLTNLSYLYNPLPYALKKAHQNCVEYLITNDAPLKCIELYLEALNTEDESVRTVTPPLTTVIVGRLFDGFTSDVFKFLLRKMYPRGRKNDQYCAVMNNLIECIGEIEKEAQPRANSDAVAINAYNSTYNKLATFMSILDESDQYKERVFKLIELFISNGANINGNIKDGYTALMFAVQNGMSEVNESPVTVTYEEDTSEDDEFLYKNENDMWAPVTYKNHMLEVAQLLVKNGADVNAKASNGTSVTSLLDRVLKKSDISNDDKQRWHDILLHKYEDFFDAAVKEYSWLILIVLFEDSTRRKQLRKRYNSNSQKYTVQSELLKSYLGNYFINPAIYLQEDVLSLKNALSMSIAGYTDDLQIAVYGAKIGHLFIIKYVYFCLQAFPANLPSGHMQTENPLLLAIENKHWVCAAWLARNINSKYNLVSLYFSTVQGKGNPAEYLSTEVVKRLYKYGFTSDVFKFLLGDDKYCTLMETIIKSIGEIEKKAQPSGDSNAGAINAYNSRYNKLATFMSILDESDQYKERVFKLIELFISNGANVNGKWNICNDTASTALLFATKHNNDKVSKMLIDKKADVNAKDNNDQTALMFAVQNGMSKVAELLVSRGAGVNAKASNGTSVTSLLDRVLKKSDISDDDKQRWHNILKDEHKYAAFFDAAVEECSWFILFTLFELFRGPVEIKKLIACYNLATFRTKLQKSPELLRAYLQDKCDRQPIEDCKWETYANNDTHLKEAFRQAGYTNGQQIAYYGAKIGDLFIIKYVYLSLKATPRDISDPVSEEDSNLLLHVIDNNSQDCVKWIVKFIDSGYMLNNTQQTSLCRTPQTINNNLEDVAKYPYEGFTPELFKFLLDKLSTTTTACGPAMSAIIESIGEIETVDQALTRNKLAMFMSITSGRSEATVFELTEQFISKGANIYGQWEDRNALSYALEYEFYSVAKRIVKKGTEGIAQLEVMVETDVDRQNKLLVSAIEAKCPEYVYAIHDLVKDNGDISKYKFNDAYKAAFNAKKYNVAIEFARRNIPVNRVGEHSYSHLLHHCIKDNNPSYVQIVLNVPIGDVLMVYDTFNKNIKYTLTKHMVNSNNSEDKLTELKEVLDTSLNEFKMKKLYNDIEQKLTELKVELDKSPNDLNQMKKLYNDIEQKLAELKQVLNISPNYLNQTKLVEDFKQKLTKLKEELDKSSNDLNQMKKLHIDIEQKLAELKQVLDISPNDLNQMKKLHIDIEQKLTELKVVLDESKNNSNSTISSKVLQDQELLNVCQKFINDMKKVLFKMKDIINVDIFVEKRSCMYHAIKNNNLEIVKALCSYKLDTPNINRIDANNLTAIEFAHNLHHYEIEEYLLTLTKYGCFKRGWFRKDKTYWSCSGRTRCLTDETIRAWLLFFAVSVVFILSGMDSWDSHGTSQIALYAFQGVSFLAVVITTVVSCCNTSKRNSEHEFTEWIDKSAEAFYRRKHIDDTESSQLIEYIANQIQTQPVPPTGPAAQPVTLTGPAAQLVTPTGPAVQLVTLTGPAAQLVTPTGPAVQFKLLKPLPPDKQKHLLLLIQIALKHMDTAGLESTISDLLTSETNSVNERIFPNKRTLLYYAIYYENVAAIEALCVRGADMDNLDENGITARELARNLHQKKEKKPTGVQKKNETPVLTSIDDKILHINDSLEDIRRSIENISDNSAELDELLETYGGKQERDVCRFGSAEQFYLGVVAFAFYLLWYIYLKDESLYKGKKSELKSQGNIENTSLYEACYEQCSIKDCFGCATSECSNDCYDQNCLSACLRAPSSTGSSFFTASTKAITYLPMHADKLSHPLQDISETYHQSVHKQSVAFQEAQPDMDLVASLMRRLKSTSHKFLRGFIYFKLEGQSNEYVKMSDYPVEVVSLAEKLYESEKSASKGNK